MNTTDRIQKRISLLMAILSGFIFLLNVLNYYFVITHDLLATILAPSVWVLFVIALFFIFDRRFPKRVVMWVQPTLFLILSGPMSMPSSFSFFGMWFFVLAAVLYYKYGLLDRKPVLKTILISGYYLPFLAVGALQVEGGPGSVGRIFGYGIFLLSCLAFLFVIFEEEVRDLLASNKQKDVEIAKKDAEIARLEPLSTLGERVAHVAHSFKNNLSLLGTAQFHLEQGGDVVKAARKIEEFSRSMNERIDNILMVSRASAEQTAEVFDAARVLAGLNQVYLTEPAFLQRAKVEVEANEPTPIWGVRWDFLLMAENILKNALDALDAKGEFGSIKLSLKDRRLTFANNGGAMPLCDDCQGDCLNCSRYGRPGQTTKATGSGHGLAQVFATCRQFGWTLRIRTHEDWTIFEIGLVKPGDGSSALAGGAPSQPPNR